MESIKQSFVIDGSDYTMAGNASESVKKLLKQLDLPQDVIRKTSIAMYEGEINMVIHANGGIAEVEILENSIKITLTDTGGGIADVEKAMSVGYSTANEEVRSLGFGAGMGLPNMKKYSDKMEIETEVGKGTCVRMEINI